VPQRVILCGGVLRESQDGELCQIYRSCWKTKRARRSLSIVWPTTDLIAVSTRNIHMDKMAITNTSHPHPPYLHQLPYPTPRLPASSPPQHQQPASASPANKSDSHINTTHTQLHTHNRTSGSTMLAGRLWWMNQRGSRIRMLIWRMICFRVGVWRWVG
jgi:hypothetical protein